MKSTFRRFVALAALTTATVSTLATAAPSLANNPFSQQEVDQSKFIAIASPFRNGTSHQLMVVEQINDTRACWSEAGGAPNIIDPLLMQFDFTGVCGRSLDSNGYSIRMNGEDLGLRYGLRIVRRDNDMVLVGAPRSRNGGQEIVIGRTAGVTNSYAKINLEPGWRFTKRMLGDRILGHVYLTYDGNAPDGGNNGGGNVVSRFRDTAGDIYLAEINQAVDLGFIAGFSDDNTFRPQQSLTREQLVSMVLGALSKVPNVQMTVPATATANPYSDVQSNRWSAAKIAFAKANNIVSGYENGTFRPEQPVTRAELMAVLRRAAEFAKAQQGQPGQLQGNRPAQSFADTGSHWGNALISQMSTYCGVASPLNERGNSFAPDSPAQRNYAAAATLRMLNCAKGTTTVQ
ncbi:MAG: DUF3747 domain-containing protein [Oculatellaceae cyanobacterium Prado106]|jgi:hypothetical protein|nr:DUF3747 domain-containing protein [Oculatellaceae cyanobacterium Prado106]